MEGIPLVPDALHPDVLCRKKGDVAFEQVLLSTTGNPTEKRLIFDKS